MLSLLFRLRSNRISQSTPRLLGKHEHIRRRCWLTPQMRRCISTQIASVYPADGYGERVVTAMVPGASYLGYLILKSLMEQMDIRLQKSVLRRGIFAIGMILRPVIFALVLAEVLLRLFLPHWRGGWHSRHSCRPAAQSSFA